MVASRPDLERAAGQHDHEHRLAPAAVGGDAARGEREPVRRKDREQDRRDQPVARPARRAEVARPRAKRREPNLKERRKEGKKERRKEG